MGLQGSAFAFLLHNSIRQVAYGCTCTQLMDKGLLHPPKRHESAMASLVGRLHQSQPRFLASVQTRIFPCL